MVVGTRGWFSLLSDSKESGLKASLGRRKKLVPNITLFPTIREVDMEVQESSLPRPSGQLP